MRDKWQQRYYDRYRLECRHFNGTVNIRCKAGVCYLHLAGDGPGYSHRLPCCPGLKHDPSYGDRVPCESYSPLTDQEWEAKEQERRARYERYAKAEPFFEAIRKANKGRSASGSDPCPVCGTGTLRWSIAGCNGHIHARCSTAGCLAFMQ